MPHALKRDIIGGMFALQAETVRNTSTPNFYRGQASCWPVPAVLSAGCKDSFRLTDDIMTLTCDQRYDADNMQRMARILEGA